MLVEEVESTDGLSSVHSWREVATGRGDEGVTEDFYALGAYDFLPAMNVTHVLGFRATFGSSTLRRAHGSCRIEVADFRQKGICVCGGSDREFRRDRRKTSNGVSDDRPWGARERTDTYRSWEKNDKYANGSSGNSRGLGGRYGGSKGVSDREEVLKQGRSNYRGSDGSISIYGGSGGRYGDSNEVTGSSRAGPREPHGDHRMSDGSSGNGRGLGGRYGSVNSQKYRDSDRKNYRGGSTGYGLRRDRKKQLHPGAYQMVDELTGDNVIVWGVETDDDVPVPSATDLQWRKATLALPGDASEETWAKVMEDYGASDTYSVKGVQHGGRDWTDELYEEDEGDGDDDIFDDDSESESEFSSQEEERLANRKNSRPARVKVFGRDVRGRSLLTVQSPIKNKNEIVGEPIGVSAAVSCTDTGKVRDDHLDKCFLEGAWNVEQTDLVTFPTDDLVLGGRALSSEVALEEQFRTRETSRGVPATLDFYPQVSNQVLSTVSSSAEASCFGGYTREAASSSDEISEGKGRAYENESSPIELSTNVEPSETFSASLEKTGTRRTKAERKARIPMPAPGEYYIIDISDQDGSRSRPQHQPSGGNEVGRNGTILDQLRLQATGKKPMSKDWVEKKVYSSSEENSHSSPKSQEYHRQLDEALVDKPKRSPMRDMNARDNYDSSIADDFFSQKSFENVGATAELIQALAYLQVDRPSQIQALAFAPILQSKSCIIADQTGSGKTLAYVAPLIQLLRADEAQGSKTISKKPRVLVLVPTSELASQVLRTFRALSKGGVPCRSTVITGGFKWKTQVESLEQGADVVVATPGRLLQHLDAGSISFDSLKSVVFDEVDILFDDEEFLKALQTINKAASIKVQYIHVTATLPVDVHDSLLERYPDCLSLMGPSLHRTSIGLQEILVDCSGGETDEKTPESAFVNKRTALLQLVQERPVSKTIVFCNKIETCRKVENVLSRFDRTGKKITVLPYHAALSQELRLETLETFLQPEPKQRLFLVCTDRASRGIDSLDVEHVVLFDFPRDPSEYVRRVGRTARGAGGTGKVFVFVVGKQVPAARRIMDRNDKGHPVHDVPGDRYYYSN